MQKIQVSQTQFDRLEEMLKQNKTLQIILDRVGLLGMPNWYLGAGCISQTVWNILHGFDPEQNIKDYDLVYYDAGDISKESELAFIQKAVDIFKDISVELDIVNEARVHLWVEEEFGYAIDQYQSVEEAIDTWPTTITCVGVTRNNGMMQIYATFGLDDVFNMVLRPNKKLVTEAVYINKVKKWTAIWPKLSVVGWNEERSVKV